MDVKMAFLHSELEEIVFMEIPDRLHTDVQRGKDGDRSVCPLIKSIYSLNNPHKLGIRKLISFF